MRESLLGVSSLLLLMIVHVAQVDAQPKIFDVTQFGASSDGKESSTAFLAAWKAACQFQGDASFVIPQGTFLLGQVDFGGPCYNDASPSVNINGILKADPDINNFHGDDAWITFHDLNKLTVSGSGCVLDGQGSSAWSHNTCHHDKSCRLPATSLEFQKVSNSIVSGITLVNSKAFHVGFHQCDHIIVHDLNISAPGDSPNTDGIHIGITDFINITNTRIGTGDDCISIGPGSTNVFVSNIICGPGHGISVGSLGKHKNELDVIGLRVEKSIIMNTDNGVRIKTWGGSDSSRASKFTFEDIIMINVSNPIIIDQQYCPVDGCGDKPSQVEISNVRFNKIRGTSRTSVAVNILCSEKVPCKDVELNNIVLVCLGDKCTTTTTSSCSNLEGKFSGLQFPAPCISNGSQSDLRFSEIFLGP